MLESKVSSQLRDAVEEFCPAATACQIENRVSTSDADYMIIRHRMCAGVELKVARAKATLKVKMRPGQLNRARRECQKGNAAFFLVWYGDVAYLIPGNGAEFLNHPFTFLALVYASVYSLDWPADRGPGRDIRGLLDYLLRGPLPRTPA